MSGDFRFVDDAGERSRAQRGRDPARQRSRAQRPVRRDRRAQRPRRDRPPSRSITTRVRAFNRVMRPAGANSTPGARRPRSRPRGSRRCATACARAAACRVADSVLQRRRRRRQRHRGRAGDRRERWRAAAAPKRSILFVWHTGEEQGLLGSDWFTDHPTVPRDSIVAQLNIDMIGRGGADRHRRAAGPTYLQLIGSRRLSTRARRPDRVGERRRASTASTSTTRSTRTGIREQLLLPQRSLHVRPLRHPHHVLHDRQPPGLPPGHGRAAVHRLRQDGAGRALHADVARTVANLDHRVVVDKPKPDPEGVCSSRGRLEGVPRGPGHRAPPADPISLPSPQMARALPCWQVPGPKKSHDLGPDCTP